MHKKIAYTKYYMTVLNYGSSHSQVAIKEVAEMSESAGNAETANMSYCRYNIAYRDPYTTLSSISILSL
ncbi:hypothetical protein BDZ91DRAFT_747086 [Kalaharituber pfeilii]|nr:hypothetical protein BDZ91DRAFT_747086 [Kalaharituber pfeilii]